MKTIKLIDPLYVYSPGKPRIKKTGEVEFTDERADKLVESGKAEYITKEKTKKIEKPNKSNTIAEIKTYLDYHDIEYGSNMLKVDLLQLCEEIE